MDVEIRPEPSPEERRALLVSLERLLADLEPPPAYRSGWRKQGVLENLVPDGAGEIRIERWS